VSGNVSLYNESKATGGGSAILPTPAIGGVGLLEDWEKSATIAFNDGDSVFLVGKTGDHLGQSLWLRDIHGRRDGPPPPVDLVAERLNAEFIGRAIVSGLASATHDISDGGALVAASEMALAAGVGITIEMSHCFDPAAAQLFGEDQGRFLVATSRPTELIDLAKEAGVTVWYYGTAGGNAVQDDWEHQDRQFSVPLAELRAAHEGFFPRLMGADSAVEANF
jgi:phosphoribosylformylglycinamidine (FGAM) synthase-like enzyme